MPAFYVPALSRVILGPVPFDGYNQCPCQVFDHVLLGHRLLIAAVPFYLFIFSFLPKALVSLKGQMERLLNARGCGVCSIKDQEVEMKRAKVPDEITLIMSLSRVR